MEGIALLGLAAAGYIINKNSDTHRIETNVKPTVFQNSNSSIYDLNNVADAQKYEVDRVNQNFEQSLDDKSNKVSDFNAKNKIIDANPQPKLIESNYGGLLTKDEFMTNDQGIKMAPFFKGEGPAAINFDDPRALRMHQGGFKNEFKFPKKKLILIYLPKIMWVMSLV